MLIKYKAGDVAKDLGLPNKELLEVVTKKFGEGKKYTTPLTEQELNYVFEHYTKTKQVASFDEYLASAPQPKPAAPAEPLKKADGTVVELKRTGGSNIDFKAPPKKEKPPPPPPPSPPSPSARW